MTENPDEKSLPRRKGLKRKRIGIRITSSSSMLVCALFLASGIISIALSVFVRSNVIALVGLGLLFWGALFLFISPKRRVDGRFLFDNVLAMYATVERIIAEFKIKGKGYHIPPYPKDIYLPEHLKGLKDPIVFVPDEDKFSFPSIEQISESRFRLTNPKGIVLTPTGVGFLNQIENKLQINFAKTSLSELSEILPKVILENFDLAEDIKMTAEENQIKLQITNSLYKDLYSAGIKSKSVSILGCPIASAVACIIAKVTGRPVAIQTYKTSADGLTVQIRYNVEQGTNT
jgi:hypothetical protein